MFKCYTFYLYLLTAGLLKKKHGIWESYNVVPLPILVSLIALTIPIIPMYPLVMMEIKSDLKYIAVRKQLCIYINSYILYHSPNDAWSTIYIYIYILHTLSLYIVIRYEYKLFRVVLYAYILAGCWL